MRTGVICAPQRGEIWWFDPDPVRGRELGRKIRPGLIVSTNGFNTSGLERVIVVPTTKQKHPLPSHIAWEYQTPTGPSRSYFCCEDVRAISVERLTERLGDRPILQNVMVEVERTLRRIMGL